MTRSYESALPWDPPRALQRPLLGSSMTLAATHDPANAFLSPEAVLLGPVLQVSQGHLAHTKAPAPGTPLGTYSAPF